MENFDFAGFLGSKQFEGGTTRGHQMIIGSGQFIPGFEEQMFGMSVGEPRDVVVTFPKNYPAPHLANKEVTFKVKINGIKKARIRLCNIFQDSMAIFLYLIKLLYECTT